MKNRVNKIFERAINRGVMMSRNTNYMAAKKMMMKVGIPNKIITRVLLQPNNVRSIDIKIS
ncbi:MAG: phage tail protein [Bacteroidia bacterium]|nr:phage tail protein [Methylotenera sp.]